MRRRTLLNKITNNEMVREVDGRPFFIVEDCMESKRIKTILEQNYQANSNFTRNTGTPKSVHMLCKCIKPRLGNAKLIPRGNRINENYPVVKGDISESNTTGASYHIVYQNPTDQFACEIKKSITVTIAPKSSALARPELAPAAQDAAAPRPQVDSEPVTPEDARCGQTTRAGFTRRSARVPKPRTPEPFFIN